MTTIVLVDDHLVVRRGLKSLLEAESDFELVGEAGDGLEAVQLVERLKPDVLILDLMMPGLNGIEVTRQARKRSPDTQIIILSMHGNDEYVLEALRNGANGYVLRMLGQPSWFRRFAQYLAANAFSARCWRNALSTPMSGTLRKPRSIDMRH